MLESKKSKTFLTSNGHRVIVDTEDYDKVIKYSWHALFSQNRFSCIRRQCHKTKKTVLLHYSILQKKEGFQIDHINKNIFDNRKSNLRYATASQNLANRSRLKKSTSKYKGIIFCKPANKWYARITVNKKSMHLGSFSVESEAALAYNKAALKYFGEFAVLNIIHEQDYSFLFPVC